MIIPQYKPYISRNDIKSITKYVNSGGFMTEHLVSKKFEEHISRITKSKNTILTNNGTISLSLIGMSIGISKNDEVIVPNYTMVASANAFKMLGAKIIFCDICEKDLTLDISRAKNLITKNTKAIVFVSSNGRYSSYDLKKFKKFLEKKKIFLIEDAAQSLSSYDKNKNHIGTIGHFGSFSFSPAKIITTGQGGAIITDNQKYAKKIRLLKNFGRSKAGNDIHKEIGFNFQFTDLQASLGISQISDLAERSKRKKDIWRYYYKNLNNPILKIIYCNLEYTTPWFVELISLSKKLTANKIKSYLANFNISSRNMYPPINKQKAYKIDGVFPVSEKIGKYGLWLPCYHTLKKKDLDFIISKLNSIEI